MSSDIHPAAQVRYARIYQDYEDGCLYIRGLSNGHALVAHLVRQCSNGVVCVRKSIRRRGASDLELAKEAVARDIRLVTRLQEVSHASGKHLRVPRLLSSTLSGDHGHEPVSYWEFCNGGTLFSFLMRCKAKGVALPVNLALDFIRQVLETLEFLHTALVTPVFHGDLHSFNLALHFTPGRTVPELRLLDFGHAKSLAATVLPDDDTERPTCTDPDTAHDPTRWDIGSVLTWIRRDLLPRVMLRRKDLTDLQEFRIAAFLAKPGDDDERTEPLRHAYRMLQRLADQIGHDFSIAQARANQHAKDPATAPPPMPTLPSLKPVIKFLRRPHRIHDLSSAKAHCVFWDTVVEHTRARAVRYEGLDPLVCMTPGGLLEILHDAGMSGPWDVAMVDVGERKMSVVGVLHGLEREVGGEVGYEDEEEEEEESDREYGELW